MSDRLAAGVRLLAILALGVMVGLPLILAWVLLVRYLWGLAF